MISNEHRIISEHSSKLRIDQESMEHECSICSNTKHQI